MIFRVTMAGLLGGLAMFIAVSIAHKSPLAQIGVGQLADGPVLADLQTATENRPGLYLYPKVDMNAKDAMAKSLAARKIHPSGILVYQRPGAPGLSFRLLGTELLTEIVQTLIAAVLLAWAAITSYGRRVAYVVLLGCVSAITTNISYWNWYGFPANYTLAYMSMEIAGFVAAAFVVAAIVKPSA